jgi:acyl-CoA synthetase (AMP-forming)/AMP-acid ligase II
MASGSMSSPGFLKFLTADPGSRVLFDATSGCWFTRGDLADRVSAAAGALQFSRKALGFLFAANDAASLIAYLAALEAGHAIFMLDPELDTGFKSRLISLFCPDFIMTPETNLPESTWLGPGRYSIARLPGTGQSLWRSNEPHRYPVHPDLTLLISTSGSTGSPKLVRLSWRNLESNALAINEVLHSSADDRAMVTSPIFNAYGLSVLNSNLIAGGSLVLTHERLMTQGFWNTARDTRCNTIGGTPFFYQMLDRLDLDTLAMPQLLKFVQAGGRLSEALVRKYHATAQQRCGSFHVMYGQAEATARISVLPPEFLPGAARSVGFALPGGRLSVESDGQSLSAGEEGELAYEGPNVMMGYAQSPSDLAEGDLLHGKLLTGDLGYRDHRGLFYITGRKARFAKVFGWRVSLDDVEEILSPVGPVAAVNENDRIIIHCEQRGDGFAEHARVLGEKVKLHPSGYEFRRVDRLPRLANDKIDYPALTHAPVR